MKILLSLLTVTLIAACSNVEGVNVHTPDVVEQDAPHEVDAGTNPSGTVCNKQEAAAGRCG
jgi:uncharacterized lipoprotein